MFSTRQRREGAGPNSRDWLVSELHSPPHSSSAVYIDREENGDAAPKGVSCRSPATQYPRKLRLKALKLVLDVGFGQSLVCERLF